MVPVLKSLSHLIAYAVRASGNKAGENIARAGPAVASATAAAASDAVNHKITDIADPLVDECYHRLSLFCSTAAKNQVTPELRTEMAHFMEDFNRRRTIALAEYEREALRAFLENLKSEQPLNYPLIERAFRIIEEKWKSQTGLIAQIVERALEQLRRVLNLTPSMGQETKLAPKKLDDAYQLIANLHERASANQPVYPNDRQAVAIAIGQLTESMMSHDELRDLAAIADHINSNQGLNPEIVSKGYEIIKKKWIEQSGLPAIVLDALSRETQRALATRSIIEATAAVSHPLIDRCYRQVSELREQVDKGKKELKPAQRQEIARGLEELEKGLPSEQQPPVQALRVHLSSPDPLNQEIISTAHKIIEGHWKQNSGLLAAVVEAVSCQAKRAWSHSSVVCSTTKLSHPLVQWCYTEVTYLFEHIAEAPKVFPVTDPQLFANNFGELAAELSETDNQIVMTLRHRLYNQQPLEREAIEKAYMIISKIWQEQSGPLVVAADSLARQFRRTLGIPASRHIAEENIEVITKAKLEAYAKEREETAPPSSSESKWREIDDQISTLQNHVYRKVVATILFYLSNIPSTKLSQFLSRYSSQEASEELFKQALFEIIEQEDIPPFRLFLVKACYTLGAPFGKYFIRRYVENIVGNLRGWITNHEGVRLETLNKVLIQGLKSCFSGILLTYDKIRETLSTQQPTDIDDLLIEQLETLKIKKQTQDQILHQLIHSFLAYSPELNWAQSAKSECRERRKAAKTKNSFFLVGWWYLREQLFNLAGIVTLPFQWVIQKITGYFAGLLIKNAIPSLYEKTTSAIGMGGFYVHPLNDFLARKLGEINRELDKKNGEAVAEAATSVQIPQKMRTNIEKAINAVLKTLLQQRQADDIASFRKDETPVPDIPLAGMLMFAPPAITVQIIPFIKKFTHQDFLEDFLLTALKNANQQFVEAPQQTQEDPERSQKQETEVEVQLKDLGKKTIKQAIDEAFHPQKRIQKEINAFFISFYKGVYRFIKKQENGSYIPNLDFENFAPFKKKWDDFLEVRKRLEQHINENTDESTRTKISNILTQFDAASKQFSQNLTQLQLKIASLQASETTLELLKELQTAYATNPPLLDTIFSILRKIDSSKLPDDLKDKVRMFHSSFQSNLRQNSGKSVQYYSRELDNLIRVSTPSQVAQIEEIRALIGTTKASFQSILSWLHSLEPFRAEAQPSLAISALKATFPQETIVKGFNNQMLSLPGAALEFGNDLNDPQKVKIKVVALYIIQRYLAHSSTR